MLKIKHIKHRNGVTRHYLRHSYWSIPEALTLLQKNKKKNLKYFTVGDTSLKTTTPKNTLFLLNYQKWKGKCQCDICGLEAKYAVLEKDSAASPRSHFNLYTVVPKTNQEIYFNIDHIRPKSKGGTNEMSNLQLTCQVCNSKKANTFTRWAEVKDTWGKIKRKWREIYHLLRKK